MPFNGLYVDNTGAKFGLKSHIADPKTLKPIDLNSRENGAVTLERDENGRPVGIPELSRAGIPPEFEHDDRVKDADHYQALVESGLIEDLYPPLDMDDYPDDIDDYR